MAEEKHIFVSHCGEHEKYIEPLKALLGNKGYEFKDSTPVLSDPNNAKSDAYAKSLVAKDIKWAGTVFVLIGRDTAESDWVNWEIEYAAQKGKQIIGVFLRSSFDFDVPPALEEYGDALVGWNSDSIEAAMNGSREWQNQDGSRRANRNAPRGSC